MNLYMIHGVYMIFIEENNKIATKKTGFYKGETEWQTVRKVEKYHQKSNAKKKT